MPVCVKCKAVIPDGSLFCNMCGARQQKPQASHRVRGNGMGTAFKRGKTWTAAVTLSTTVDDSGKIRQHRKTKGGFAKKSDALAWCLAYDAATAPKKAPPLSVYWDLYSGGEMDALSESKRTAYKIAWDKLSPLHFLPVDTLTVSQLRETVGSAAPTYYPARDMKTLLQHLFTLAGADGFVDKSLPSYIVLPKLQETPREAFTQEEQTALWRIWEKGNTDAALPLIMIYTGMMPGELRRLRSSMVDFSTSTIHGVGLKTKVRKAADVVLPDCILPVLRACMEDHPNLIFDFCENIFYERYYAALAAAKCRKLTPYSCRHTTATALAITENIAPQTIRLVMRWSTTRMLDRYAHPDSSDALTAVNRLTRV